MGADARRGHDHAPASSRCCWRSSAVLVFMIVYYRFAGFVACVALLANLLLTVGFMVAVQATFTLPGLAGLVLMLGMAVDANVLIYERLREERERGASLALAIRNGYDRALPTIIDTHLSEHLHRHRALRRRQRPAQGLRRQPDRRPDHQPVHLAVHDPRDVRLSGIAKGWLHQARRMMRLFARPNIDFMSIRYVMFAGHARPDDPRPGAVHRTACPNDLNIDFVGGTAYGGQLTRADRHRRARASSSTKTHQKELLKVDAGRRRTDRRRTHGDIYLIKYHGDETPRPSRSANKPEGRHAAGPREDVKERRVAPARLRPSSRSSSAPRRTDGRQEPLLHRPHDREGAGTGAGRARPAAARRRRQRPAEQGLHQVDADRRPRDAT